MLPASTIRHIVIRFRPGYKRCSFAARRLGFLQTSTVTLAVRAGGTGDPRADALSTRHLMLDDYVTDTLSTKSAVQLPSHLLGGSFVVKKWHVKVGDTIQFGQPLVDLAEGDRLLTIEYIPDARVRSGRVEALLFKVGDAIETAALPAKTAPSNPYLAAFSKSKEAGKSGDLRTDGTWTVGNSTFSDGLVIARIVPGAIWRMDRSDEERMASHAAQKSHSLVNMILFFVLIVSMCLSFVFMWSQNSTINPYLLPPRFLAPPGLAASLPGGAQSPISLVFCDTVGVVVTVRDGIAIGRDDVLGLFGWLRMKLRTEVVVWSQLSSEATRRVLDPVDPLLEGISHILCSDDGLWKSAGTKPSPHALGRVPESTLMITALEPESLAKLDFEKLLYRPAEKPTKSIVTAKLAEAPDLKTAEPLSLEKQKESATSYVRVAKSVDLNAPLPNVVAFPPRHFGERDPEVVRNFKALVTNLVNSGDSISEPLPLSEALASPENRRYIRVQPVKVPLEEQGKSQLVKIYTIRSGTNDRIAGMLDLVGLLNAPLIRNIVA